MVNDPHYVAEKDAARMACPLSVGNGMNNRILIIDGLEAGRPCIGSRCMAWRWKPVWNDDEEEIVEYEAKGYCGMISE